MKMKNLKSNFFYKLVLFIQIMDLRKRYFSIQFKEGISRKERRIGRYCIKDEINCLKDELKNL